MTEDEHLTLPQIYDVAHSDDAEAMETKARAASTLRDAYDYAVASLPQHAQIARREWSGLAAEKFGQEMSDIDAEAANMQAVLDGHPTGLRNIADSIRSFKAQTQELKEQYEREIGAADTGSDDFNAVKQAAREKYNLLGQQAMHEVVAQYQTDDRNWIAEPKGYSAIRSLNALPPSMSSVESAGHDAGQGIAFTHAGARLGVAAGEAAAQIAEAAHTQADSSGSFTSAGQKLGEAASDATSVAAIPASTAGADAGSSMADWHANGAQPAPAQPDAPDLQAPGAPPAPTPPASALPPAPTAPAPQPTPTVPVPPAVPVNPSPGAPARPAPPSRPPAQPPMTRPVPTPPPAPGGNPPGGQAPGHKAPGGTNPGGNYPVGRNGEARALERLRPPIPNRFGSGPLQPVQFPNRGPGIMPRVPGVRHGKVPRRNAKPRPGAGHRGRHRLSIVVNHRDRVAGWGRNSSPHRSNASAGSRTIRRVTVAPAHARPHGEGWSNDPWSRRGNHANATRPLRRVVVMRPGTENGPSAWGRNPWARPVSGSMRFPSLRTRGKGKGSEEADVYASQAEIDDEEAEMKADMLSATQLSRLLCEASPSECERIIAIEARKLGFKKTTDQDTDNPETNNS